MALPPCETFQYITTIPAEIGQDLFSWPTQLGESLEPSGESFFDHRLVGYAPSLRISEGRAIPDPTGLRTTMTQSCLTLSASSRDNATASDASFHVDRELTLLLQPGDVLHLSYSCMWGTGLSLLRQGRLVFAVGAILGLPLGQKIRVKLPEDVFDQLERFHRVPFSIRGKQPLLIPIEIHVGNEMRSIFAGTVELGEYEIWVEGGRDYSYPSGDTFAAISAKGLCHSIPAVASAILLNRLGLERTEWPK
jgi:hypothetical protein